MRLRARKRKKSLIEINSRVPLFFFYLQRSHRRGVDSRACWRRRRSLVGRLMLLAGGQARAIAAAARRGRGIVVIPGAPTLFTLNTRAASLGNLFVSVASTANVTVYLSGLVI